MTVRSRICVNSKSADIDDRTKAIEQLGHLAASLASDPSIIHNSSQIPAAASVSCITGTQRGPYPTATKGRFALVESSTVSPGINRMLALNWAFD